MKFTPKQLNKKVDNYIAKCQKNKSTIFLIEFALECGLSRMQLHRYRAGDYGIEYQEPIERLDMMQELGLMKVIDTPYEKDKSLAIFMLKSKYNFTDKPKEGPAVVINFDLENDGKNKI